MNLSKEPCAKWKNKKSEKVLKFCNFYCIMDLLRCYSRMNERF